MNAQIAVATDGDLEAGEIKDDRKAKRSSDDEYFPLGVEESEVPPLIANILRFMGWYALVGGYPSSKRRQSNACWPAISAVMYFLTYDGAWPLTAGIASYKVTGSVALGGAVGSWMFLGLSYFWVISRIITASPIFHEVLRSKKTRMRMVNVTRKQLVFFAVQMGGFILLVDVFILAPMLSEDNSATLLGSTGTKWLLWFTIIFQILGMPYACILCSFGLQVWFGVEHATTSIINEYIKSVRSTMLDSDSGTMFDRLSRNQNRAEAFGRLKNRSFSVMYGLSIAFFSVSTFAFLALAGIQAAKEDATAGQLAFLIFLSSICFGFGVAWGYLPTMTNRAFIQAKQEVLNDAKLLPVIAQKLHNHKMFREWLDAHEISAARIFGVRVTTKGMAEVCTVLGSLVVILAAFIVRSHIIGENGVSL